MPHSVFTGRVVEPGEPLFLVEDTDGAIALAEEERDTCPSCGYPKVWCRDPGNQFAFEVHEEQCHVTYAMNAHRNKVSDSRDEATSKAIQSSPRFRETASPDIYAGLDLAEESRDGDEQPDDGHEH